MQVYRNYYVSHLHCHFDADDRGHAAVAQIAFVADTQCRLLNCDVLYR
jgi:hypothetical protein